MLVTLTFVYVLNFLDRQLLGILAKPIQDELHITDGQLGLIGGLYFAFFYCFIAIPVGWFADRTNRVTVLSLACAIWSAATVACWMLGQRGNNCIASGTRSAATARARSLASLMIATRCSIEKRGLSVWQTMPAPIAAK